MLTASIQECSNPAERKLSRLSLFSFLFALAFWIWAVVNTFTVKMNGEIDTGVFSFFTVILSSAYVYHVTTSGQTEKLGGCCATTLVILTHAFVVATYIVGIFMGFGYSFAYSLYCMIFTVIWTAIMVVTSTLIKSSVIASGSNNNDTNDATASPEVELAGENGIL